MTISKNNNRRAFVARTLALAVPVITFSNTFAKNKTTENFQEDLPIRDYPMGYRDTPITATEFSSMTCPLAEHYTCR